MGGLPVQQMRHDLPQTEGAGSRHGAVPSLSIGRVKTNPFHRTARTLPGLALTLSLALMSASTFPAIDSKAGKFYEDALTRYEKKDYPGAIVQLKSALQADRSMLPVHVLLGKTLMANGEVVAAEAAFTEALRLGVNRTEIAVPLARAVMAQGRQKEVVEQERFQLAGLSADTQYYYRFIGGGARLKYALSCASVDLTAGKKPQDSLSTIQVRVEIPSAIVPYGKPVTLNASASGGKAPYSYAWSTGCKSVKRTIACE